ncbi:hypothetical protein MLD38_011471 [Melastoma candidum]|uniref:Uncharacterized protein n=1 Tax=Melastoma candidum TaxID=119954 RepID=A0ACB9R7B3_9MYRT|nr:hypothetical protein MLD38_011471 [Melastoma candidum]
MESKEQSLSPENTDTKAKFLKPSNDASGRKYRRHSPVDESSSPDGSLVRDHPSSPMNVKYDSSKFRHHGSRRKFNEGDLYKDSGRSRFGKDSDSYRYSGRDTSRSSHSYSRSDEHGSYETGYRRSKDYERDVNRYAQGKDDNNGGYRGRGRERESFSPVNDEDRDDLSHLYESRRKKNDVEGLGRDGREHDSGDHEERKDHSGISRGHINGGNRIHSRSEQRESSFRSDSDGYHNKDASNSKRDSHRLAGEKDSTDKWDLKNKDLKSKETELYLDDTAVHKDSDIGSMKRQKMFNSIEDPNPDYHNQIKESHKASEIIASSKALTDIPNAATDLNAAKFAAMKAAEMVNKNLAGGFGAMGYMSTEQKKKLLWGNKKSTATEESGSQWDVSLIADRERQEKFHKLMGVKGEIKAESKPNNQDGSSLLRAEKQKELQLDLEKQYTAGLRRRDGRTVGLGL